MHHHYAFNMERCGCLKERYSSKPKFYSCPSHLQGSYTPHQFQEYTKILAEIQCEVIGEITSTNEKIAKLKHDLSKETKAAEQLQFDMGDVSQAIASLAMSNDRLR